MSIHERVLIYLHLVQLETLFCSYVHDGDLQYSVHDLKIRNRNQLLFLAHGSFEHIHKTICPEYRCLCCLHPLFLFGLLCQCLPHWFWPRPFNSSLLMCFSCLLVLLCYFAPHDTCWEIFPLVCM